jgi:cell wall assembly regulator SMI1
LKADKIVRLLKAAGAKPTEAEAISVSMDIVESWKRIEKWLKGNAPNWKPLKKAATEAQIKHLEKELGVTLPEDFKLSYRRHNEAEDLFPETDISYSLIPTTQILSDWKMLNGLVESGDFDNRKATSDTGIQKKWWTPDWIPFASNGGGDYFCLDLKPLKKGTVGQIISVNHESGERRLQAPSFAHWLFDFANQLKAGTWKYEEGEGLVS